MPGKIGARARPRRPCDDGNRILLFRDYETKSAADLKSVGARKYAQHPSTDVWCCAYALDDGPVQIWKPGDPVPPEFVEAAKNSNWQVVAFNAAFERAMETHILGPRYGWPTIPIERHRCLQLRPWPLPCRLRSAASPARSAWRRRKMKPASG